MCLSFKSLLCEFLVKQQARVKQNRIGACLVSYRMTDVAVWKAKRWTGWSSFMPTWSSSISVRNVSYAYSIFWKIRTYANVFYFSVRVSSSFDSRFYVRCTNIIRPKNYTAQPPGQWTWQYCYVLHQLWHSTTMNDSFTLEPMVTILPMHNKSLYIQGT